MAAYTRHDYDVLVIGAGGAGLRAAIEAAGAGVSVELIGNSLPGKAHTNMADGGLAAGQRGPYSFCGRARRRTGLPPGRRAEGGRR